MFGLRPYINTQATTRRARWLIPSKSSTTTFLSSVSLQLRVVIHCIRVTSHYVLHHHFEGSVLNYDPNFLKVAKLTSEAETHHQEAWAETYYDVL
jgi:hypothetical protein